LYKVLTSFPAWVIATATPSANTEPLTAMNLNYLDFEQPIAELEGKIEELQLVGNSSDVNIADEIAKLRQKSSKLTELPVTHSVLIPQITFHAFLLNLKSCMATVTLATTKPLSAV
jgi:CO dehydrogenase/acetyl-CoA synthase delta subunit